MLLFQCRLLLCISDASAAQLLFQWFILGQFISGHNCVVQLIITIGYHNWLSQLVATMVISIDYYNWLSQLVITIQLSQLVITTGFHNCVAQLRGTTAWYNCMAQLRGTTGYYNWLFYWPCVCGSNAEHKASPWGLNGGTSTPRLISSLSGFMSGETKLDDRESD